MGGLNTSALMNYYDEHDITAPQLKEVARCDSWRSMWSVGKKTNTPLFSSLLTKDQISLSSYSSMYDNVREHPECPDEQVINDDDCLDGWFIDTKKKVEQDKKKAGVISNKRISDSKEIFLMADDEESAQGIYELNNTYSRGTIINRQNTIGDGTKKDIDFADIKQELEMRGVQATTNHLRRK